MKVFVIGSGGREHALIDTITRSKRVSKIYAAPGNGGISSSVSCVDIKVDDIDKLKTFAINNKIDWVVIGPEYPLTLGLSDELRKAGIKTFGVSKQASMLEASKSFAKGILKKYKIPSAGYEVFDSYDNAIAYISNITFPTVIKANGLAAGKGVYICHNLDEAKTALNDIFIIKKFSTAGDKVVIEDFLIGKEISAFAFTDGNSVIPLIYAQDYKKIYDNDKGPNTGGMGCYTPVSFMTKELQNKVLKTVLEPTIRAMNSEGILYQGILYAGLMIDNYNNIKVLEFNVRFGDPEAQVILTLLNSDIIGIFEAIHNKTLHKEKIIWQNKKAICVVLASKGYPGSYTTGYPISGLSDCNKIEGIKILHAGTKKDNNNIITSGGRVLNVVAIGDSFENIYKNVYKAVDTIKFDNKVFRRDIAYRELKD